MVIKYREPGILSRFNYVIRSDSLLRVQLGFSRPLGRCHLYRDFGLDALKSFLRWDDLLTRRDPGARRRPAVPGRVFHGRICGRRANFEVLSGAQRRSFRFVIVIFQLVISIN